MYKPWDRVGLATHNIYRISSTHIFFKFRPGGVGQQKSNQAMFSVLQGVNSGAYIAIMFVHDREFHFWKSCKSIDSHGGLSKNCWRYISISFPGLGD